MELMLSFVVAMSVTMVLIPALMRVAGRSQLLDQPNPRKVHVTPVPRVGGVAMAVGVLLALGFWGDFDRQLQAYCAGVLILAVFGTWDDRVELGASMKLVGQSLAVLVAMLWGNIGVDSITLGGRDPLPALPAQVLTFVFLIGVTNAINLSDGLDGLAGGMSLLCLGALALMAFTVGNAFVGPVALVAIGAIVGFLRFNTYPARVFMGDCGSQILGFSAAMLSVALTQDPEAPLSAALPLLLLGVPVIDTLAVMSKRLLQGRSPFRADRNHIHHRLLALGLHHHEAVMTMYALQGLLLVCAWFLRYHSDLASVAVFLASGTLLVGTLHLAAARGWRIRPTMPGLPVAAGAFGAWLGRAAMPVIIAGLGAYAAIIAARVQVDAPIQMLALAVALALGAVLALRWRGDEFVWLARAGLYLACLIGVYVQVQASSESPSLGALRIALLAILALALLLSLRGPAHGRIRVNPLDLLVIFMALAVPNLPGSIAAPQALGAAVAQLTILLYAVEAICVRFGHRWRGLCLAALLFLLACAVGGH